MGISDKNTRTIITIDKEFKEQLTQLAKDENRTFNNLVITALQEFVSKDSSITFGQLRKSIDDQVQVSVNVISKEDSKDLVAFSNKESVKKVGELFNSSTVNSIKVDNKKLVIYLDE